MTRAVSTIRYLFDEAIGLNKSNPISFMTGEKRFKEQWLLGRFSKLYNRERENRRFDYATKLNESDFGQNTPDFEVFDEKQSWVTDVEITEALDQSRHRDDEYKSVTSKLVHIEEWEYIPTIQERIDDKCQKRYPRKTWLIVYQNIYSSMHDYFPTNKLIDIQIPQSCKFEKIFILDSDGNKYVRLYSGTS